MLLSGFIAAVVLDKAHNLVRKGFPAGFAEMDMNVKGRAADVLHKVGLGGQRGSGCGGAGLAGFIVHRLLLSMKKALMLRRTRAYSHSSITLKVRKCKVQRVCVLHFQLAGSGGCSFLMKLYH